MACICWVIAVSRSFPQWKLRNFAFCIFLVLLHSVFLKSISLWFCLQWLGYLLDYFNVRSDALLVNSSMGETVMQNPLQVLLLL
jgi:hypothetical protein